MLLVWLNVALGLIAFAAWGRRAFKNHHQWQYRVLAGGIALMGLYFGVYYGALALGFYNAADTTTWMRGAVTALLSFVSALALLRD